MNAHVRALVNDKKTIIVRATYRHFGHGVLH